MNTRDVRIDYLKAFAIILVILGHIIQSTISEFDKNMLFRIIYSFHMPLFMAISGYLAICSNLGKGYIAKRFNQLVIPFLVWSLIYIVFINIPLIARFDLSFFLPYYKGLVKSPDNGGLWFLWVLFLINVLFYVFRNIKLRSHILLLLAFVLYAIPYVFKIDLVLGFAFVRWYLPFYLLGIYLKQSNLTEKIKLKHTVILLIILILLESIWSRTGVYCFNFELSKPIAMSYNLGISYLVATSAIIIFFKVFRLFKKPYKEIQWLSINTLAIYSVHFYVLGVVINLFNKFLSGSFFYDAVVFISTLGFTLLLILLLKKVKIFDRILFGNINNGKLREQDVK